MSKSERFVATAIAVLVWLVVGFALVSSPMAQRTGANAAADAHPSQAGSGWRTAFL